MISEGQQVLNINLRENDVALRQGWTTCQLQIISELLAGLFLRRQNAPRKSGERFLVVCVEIRFQQLKVVLLQDKLVVLNLNDWILAKQVEY